MGVEVRYDIPGVVFGGVFSSSNVLLCIAGVSGPSASTNVHAHMHWRHLPAMDLPRHPEWPIAMPRLHVKTSTAVKWGLNPQQTCMCAHAHWRWLKMSPVEIGPCHVNAHVYEVPCCLLPVISDLGFHSPLPQGSATISRRALCYNISHCMHKANYIFQCFQCRGLQNTDFLVKCMMRHKEAGKLHIDGNRGISRCRVCSLYAAQKCGCAITLTWMGRKINTCSYLQHETERHVHVFWA